MKPRTGRHARRGYPQPCHTLTSSLNPTPESQKPQADVCGMAQCCVSKKNQPINGMPTVTAPLSAFPDPLGHAQRRLPDSPQEQQGRALGAEAGVRVRCCSIRTTWTYSNANFVTELSGPRSPLNWLLFTFLRHTTEDRARGKVGSSH